FNPLAWQRSDIAEVEVELPEAAAELHVTDANGKAMQHQLLQRLTPNRFRLIFRAQDLPSMGYKMFYVSAASAGAPPASDLQADKFQMENEFLRVSIDPKSGCIASL